MALKRTSSASYSPATITRASCDAVMTSRSSIQTSPPISSCVPATTLNTVSGVPKTTRWLPHIMPIEGSESNVIDRAVMYLYIISNFDKCLILKIPHF